jgi:hypothetical protein
MIKNKVRDTLRARGFALESQNRHKKFKDAQGRTIILSTTPSDVNAELAQLRDIDRIASAPVYVQPERHESTAALARAPKRKAGASGNYGSNTKVVTYIKTDAPRTTEEQRETDRLESEWNRLHQRMAASFALLNRQMDEALTYCCVLYIIGGLRHHAAGILREERKKPTSNKENKAYYLKHRSSREHATLKSAAKRGLKTVLKAENIMPLLLGITEGITVGMEVDDAIADDDKTKAFVHNAVNWALGQCMQFVSIPKWLGEWHHAPFEWDAGDRRLMRFYPPPAGLRQMN